MGMEDRTSVLIRQSPVRRVVGEQGFSLIEVLIAAGILLMVALGVLPIFAQAIVNNRAGADYTQATNIAKSELERLYSLPFRSPELEVEGTATERIDYFSLGQQKWIAGPAPTADPALWTRTTTIRQYGVEGILDLNKDGALDPALPEGTDPGRIHVKEIEILVESGSGNSPLGGGKRIVLRTYKAY